MQNQQIDLLQAMSFEPTGGRSFPLWVSWALALFILLTGIGIYTKNVETTALHQEIAGLEKKKRFLIQEMGAAEATMKDVVQVLAHTLSKRVRWSQLMREVSMIIPEGVWITEWESFRPLQNPQTNTDGQNPQTQTGIQIKISGEAISQEQLTLFLSTLDRSPLLIESRLAHARKINGEVQFEVNVALKMEKPS